VPGRSGEGAEAAAGCTLPVAEGMVVRTDSPKVVEARKSMLEFLLANHPLDCPVCDKGGECELQDMTFRYGLGESRFTEIKQHVDEKQWSPLVYSTRRAASSATAACGCATKGMGVRALAWACAASPPKSCPMRATISNATNAATASTSARSELSLPGHTATSRGPWEMSYAGTICTHCADGCKTTLSVRNGEIIRANNRDRSGINGEFLCVKGRFAFDFVHSPERLQSPLIRRNGQTRAGELERGAGRGRRAVRRGAGAPRQIRRRGLDPFEQRGELLSAEVRAGGLGTRISITGARATSRLSWTR